MAEEASVSDDAELHPAPMYTKPVGRPDALSPTARSVSVSLSEAMIVVAASNSDAILRPLGPNDVIFGRGGASNNHVGNRRYRALVAERQPEYVNARKRDKAEIAREIVRTVTGVWGGLFLRKLDADEAGPGGAVNRWVDVGENRAREKTSQALREGLEVRKSGTGATAATYAAAAATVAIGGHMPVYAPGGYHPHPHPAHPDKRGLESPGDSPGKKKRGRPRKNSPASRAAEAASGAVAQMRQSRAAAPPGYPTGYPQGYYPAAPAGYPSYHYPYHAAPHPGTYGAPAGAGTQEARTAVTGETKCRKCSGILVGARACVPCGHVHCAGCVDVPLAKAQDKKSDEDAKTKDDTSVKEEGGYAEEADEKKETLEDEKKAAEDVKCPTCSTIVTATVPLECLDRIVSSCVSGQMADFTLEELEGYETRWKEMSSVTVAVVAESETLHQAEEHGEGEGDEVKGEEHEEGDVVEQEVV